MIKARHACLLWTLCILLITSCSTASNSSTGQPLKQEPTPAPEASPPQPSNPAKLTIANKTTEPEPAASKEPPEDASNPPKYYVDTKNYKIHPLDEGKSEKIALLTFDDGPKGQVTTQILDILDKYNAKSIWFVNGFNYGWDYQANPKKAETFSALLKEIHKRGHLIANHTWEHENLRKLTPEKQEKEIISMNDLIENITGERPKFFRPPFGAYSDVQKHVMKKENMQWMNWSVGSLDWEHKDPKEVVKQVVSTMHDGGNILMHDLPVTAEALEPILQELTGMGYRFVLPTEVRVE